MKAFWKALLVAAAAQMVPAFAMAQEVEVPPAVRAEFDGFIAKFRAALKADDSAAVAGLTLLPFMGDASIGDAAQFRKKIYVSDFMAENRACIQQESAVYDRDGENHDVYSIFCGELIFVFTKTASGFLLTDIGVND